MRIRVESDSKQFKLPIKVLRSLPRNRNYKLIDIGAGKRYLMDFLPKNIEYNSLDFEGDHNYLFNLDEGKLPIKNNSYDIVVCLETLEHTIYPSKVMDEIIRISKPESIFLLSMPNEYNFYCRLNFILGRKTLVQKTFRTTEDNLHIHSPRVKDILNFFSNYVKILKVDYPWYSRTSQLNKGVKSRFFVLFDNLVELFTLISPNLFARCVVIKGIKKT